MSNSTWRQALSELKAFHLGIDKSETGGATIALIPGDPDRVPKIAAHFSHARKLAVHREFTSYLGKVNGHPIIACSTGIGGPSTSICVEELARLGVRCFIRIGTTGAIQKHVKVGDVIITHGAIRIDGSSDHFAPPEYPAVADFNVTRAIEESVKGAGLPYHIGITVSSSTFYPGQERYDTYSGKVWRRFQGSLAEWQELGALNYEMEAGTLFTMASVLRLKAGCVSGCIINRTNAERVDDNCIREIEEATVKVGVAAAARLLE